MISNEDARRIEEQLKIDNRTINRTTDPKGFGNFDALARKLVKIPPSALKRPRRQKRKRK